MWQYVLDGGVSALTQLAATVFWNVVEPADDFVNPEPK
jgi:hypothetical protein